MGLTLLVLWRFCELSLKRYALWMAGGLLGAVLGGGWWGITSYKATGSPVFPLYNGLFRAPLFEYVNFADVRFLPHSLWSALSYPFQWFSGAHPSAEVPFRDARFAVIAVLMPTALFAVVKQLYCPHIGPLVRRKEFWLLNLFFLFSYIIWITTWAIQRYAIPLELIAGVILFLNVDAIVSPLRWKVLVFAALGLFCALWTRAGDWGHSPAFGRTFFEVTSSAEKPFLDDALLVIIESDSPGQPISYVLPFLPSASRVVRLTSAAGNIGTIIPARPLGVRVKELVDGHRGPIRSLATSGLAGADYTLLLAYGLAPDTTGSCYEFTTRFEGFVSCPLRRVVAVPLTSVDE